MNILWNIESSIILSYFFNYVLRKFLSKLPCVKSYLSLTTSRDCYCFVCAWSRSPYYVKLSPPNFYSDQACVKNCNYPDVCEFSTKLTKFAVKINLTIVSKESNLSTIPMSMSTPVVE